MEKYSLEKAQIESEKIKRIANETKEKRGESGEPTSEDYKKADKAITSTNESAESINRLEKFKDIKTPEELSLFMKNNLHYGFIGKKDEKIYSPQHEGWRKGEQPEQKVQIPEELLESGFGTCWEQTELERQWFKNNNYEFKTFLLMFGPEISQKNPAHTMLAFKKDDKWYWFENTLDDKNNKIHPFNSLNELIEEVKGIITDNAVSNQATEEDLEKFKLYEYDAPIHNGSTDEFLSQIINKKKEF